MKYKSISRDKNNIISGSPQTARVYDGSTKKRTPKTSKLVIKSNGKVKTVTYGPMNQKGKQTKTKVKSKGGVVF